KEETEREKPSTPFCSIHESKRRISSPGIPDNTPAIALATVTGSRHGLWRKQSLSLAQAASSSSSSPTTDLLIAPNNCAPHFWPTASCPPACQRTTDTENTEIHILFS
ncbi:mCG145484, partial [Mus musculus]